MLGNCLIRYPVTAEGRFDAGSICEALLFFSQTHVVLDHMTMGLFVQQGFLDDFIEMLERRYVTAAYSQAFTGLAVTTNRPGLKEHFFQTFRIVGDAKSPPRRGPEALLVQLESLIANRAEAKRYHRRLCEHLTFRKLDPNNAVSKAVDDLRDKEFAEWVAIAALRRLGVPSDELRFSKLSILDLGSGRFAVETDIDFERLKQYVPSRERIGTDYLFKLVGHARLNIYLAAQKNASLVGNGADQQIVERILTKTLGTRPGSGIQGAPREIYDFISVDTPSIREVINSGSRSTRDFLSILKNATAFKDWLGRQNPDKSLIQEMLKQKAAVGWLETVKMKAIRFGIFSAAGMVADLYVPGSGLALGAVDSFLIDRLSKRWRPHLFVEDNLSGFLGRHY